MPATSRKPSWPCGVCRNPNQRRRPSWLAPTAKATMRPPNKTTYTLISASCSCSESAEPRPHTPAWVREAAGSMALRAGGAEGAGDGAGDGFERSETSCGEEGLRENETSGSSGFIVTKGSAGREG